MALPHDLRDLPLAVELTEEHVVDPPRGRELDDGGLVEGVEDGTPLALTAAIGFMQAVRGFGDEVEE